MQALLSQVVAATKTSNGLPEESDDYDYYQSFPGFSTFCSKMATRIDKVISKVIRHQQLPCYWAVDSTHVGAASEATKAEEKFEVLVEANDILLERVVRISAQSVMIYFGCCEIHKNIVYTIGIRNGIRNSKSILCV